jgi:hypothetical protein
MTTPEPCEDEPEASQPDHTDIDLAYAGPSRLVTAEGKAELALFGNLKRDPVRMDAKVKDPLRLREALGALYAVVGSDYRYVPKDRTAYTAYLRMKRETSGLTVWHAQQAYYSWLLRNDPLAFVVLDPIITVHPDQVFSKFSARTKALLPCSASTAAPSRRTNRPPCAAPPTSTFRRRFSTAFSRCAATARRASRLAKRR